ncbi:adenosylcobinamide-GDP ribazoletransferase [Magnetospira sp. QH-2]|uniref:adenosylcobinamide-GDP ribazoletransferase n=1 Tax=Magnetospira sp. (strain QH-2) TaxID=1288970 RepID=UPI0003E8195B|nr:adenosylcobinamide-GDP ribazoletransferase [Magnetospira sp. QH-2]CCQ72038.1 Cobalamin synthase cobS [Magnetospira sp. QH-2]
MSTPQPHAPSGNDLLIAVGFLTRLPVPHPAVLAPDALARSVWAFPLVGLLVGGAASVVWVMADLSQLPGTVSAMLAVMTVVILTGALHEDGLADLVDGLGGGWDRERRLEVMRDSRVGVFGVLGLIFSVALRVAVLASVDHAGQAVPLILASETLSRGVIPQVMLRLSPARADGLAQGAGRPQEGASNLALLMAGGLVILLLGFQAGGGALAGGLVAAWAVASLAKAKLGGQTGDVLGAVQQAALLAALVGGLGAGNWGGW